MNAQNFSNEILNAAANAMHEYQNEMAQLHEQANSEPYVEVAQCYLMEKLDMTQSEAEEVCNELQTGITDFEAQLQANIADSKVNLREKLQQATAEMDDQMRSEFLSAVLTAFQSSQLTGVTAEQVTELQKDNAKRPVEELIDEIEQLFNGEITFGNLATYVNANIDADAIVKLSQQIGKNKDEYRFLSALMLYVAQQEGKVKLSDTGEKLPATLVGSLACASAELVTITADLKEDKIDLKRWQLILKCILGALIAIVLSVVSVLVITFAFTSLATFFIDIFGIGLLSVMTAVIVSVFGSLVASKYTVDAIGVLLEILSDAYDKYIEPVSQKIQSWAKAMKAWFRSVSGKKEEHNATQEVEPEVQVVVEDPVIATPSIVTAS